MYSRGVWVFSFLLILSHFGIAGMTGTQDARDRAFAFSRQVVDQKAFEAAKEAILRHFNTREQEWVLSEINAMEVAVTNAAYDMYIYRASPTTENRIEMRTELRYLGSTRGYLERRLSRLNPKVRGKLNRRLWNALGYKIEKRKTPIARDKETTAPIFKYEMDRNESWTPAHPQKIERFLDRMAVSPPPSDLLPGSPPLQQTPGGLLPESTPFKTTPNDAFNHES